MSSPARPERAIDFVLETRTCDGGCGKEFRCLPTSSARRASAFCEQQCKGAPLTRAQTAQRKCPRKFRPKLVYVSHDVKPIVMGSAAERGRVPIWEQPCSAIKAAELIPERRAVPKSNLPLILKQEPGQESTIDLIFAEPVVPEVSREKLWESCLREAKDAMVQIAHARRKVALLALACCDVVRGGGAHWSGHDGIYTLRRFSKEIGVNYKTMMNWIEVERMVVPGLKAGEYREEDYKHANNAIKRCRSKGLDVVRDEFRRLRDGGKQFARLVAIVQWTRSHRSFLREAPLGTLDRTSLVALGELCDEIKLHVDRHLAGEPQ